MNALRVLTSTATPAFATDDKGRVVGLNQAAEVVFGYRSSQVLNKACHEVFVSTDPFGNMFCHGDCAVRAMVRKNEPVSRFEMTIRCASGRPLRGSVTILVVDGQAGGDGRVVIHLFRPIHETVVSMEDGHPADTDGSAPEGAGDAHAPSARAAALRLTPREVEVLRMMTLGKSSHQIAQACSISLATARNHIQHLLQKLEVHSQVEAVARALRERLV